MQGVECLGLSVVVQFASQELASASRLVETGSLPALKQGARIRSNSQINATLVT